MNDMIAHRVNNVVQISIAAMAFFGTVAGGSAGPRNVGLQHRTDRLAGPFTQVAENQSRFQTYDNYDLTGPGLRSFSGADLAACSNACQSDRQCQGFSFDKWQNRCVLKQAAGSFRFEPRSASGIAANSALPSTSNEPIVMQCFPGKNFSAARHKSLPSSSFQQCQKSCEDDKDCVAFAHLASTKMCSVYQTVDRMTSDQTAISGVKRQLAVPSEASEGGNCASFGSMPSPEQAEEDLYQSARGDAAKLREYLAHCSVCSHAEEARQGIAWLDQQRRQNATASPTTQNPGPFEPGSPMDRFFRHFGAPSEQSALGLTLAPAHDVAGAEGVLVTKVDPNGRAAGQGLMAGDIILEVAGRKVSAPADVTKMVNKARSESKRVILMRIKRSDGNRFVAIPIAALPTANSIRLTSDDKYQREWERVYPAAGHDVGVFGILSLRNGDLLMQVQSKITRFSMAGDYCSAIMRIKGDGTPLWMRYPDSKHCDGDFVFRLLDDNSILAIGIRDYLRERTVAMRLTPEGRIIWQKVVIGVLGDVVDLSAQDFLIIGSKTAIKEFGGGLRVGWALPISVDAASGHEHRLGSPNLQRTLRSALRTNDGGVILGGTTSVPERDWNGWLLRLDHSLSTVWEKFFGVSRSTVDALYALGNSYLVILSRDGHQSTQLFLIDQSGNAQWQIPLPSDVSQAKCVLINDGRCLLATWGHGPTVQLSLVNQAGNLEPIQTFSFESGPDDVAALSTGDLIIAGHRKDGGKDVGWVARYVPNSQLLSRLQQ